MDSIEIQDVQGLITKGYSSLPACNFLLLSIKDKGLVKTWLKQIAGKVTSAQVKPETSALNLAMTYEGLKKLGLPQECLETFPLELEDGMITPHKQLFLGDFDQSAPANWNWGGTQHEAVDMLLMIYAADEQILDSLYLEHSKDFNNSGLKEIKRLETSVLSKRKEHFGFHDGIAQPTIKGLSRVDVPANTVDAGEFILGYKNSYDQYPETPVVSEAVGESKILPEARAAGMRDLGKNGSYLVFRQMEQDVKLFWNYMEKATMVNGVCNSAEMIKMAAKMVGRWPSGAPVSLCPDKDDESMENKDGFGYHALDTEGLKCPIGSHIRRSNPRDTMDVNIKASVDISNKHRLLRRGRSYGKPVCESLNPEDILSSKNFEGERGLHFICINTDISRQFEFIQNAWVNNPKLFNLYDERDPVIGNNHHPEDDRKTGVFSMPMKGLRTRYTDVPQFVTIKGGGYFFMPGIKAITYLSSI